MTNQGGYDQGYKDALGECMEKLAEALQSRTGDQADAIADSLVREIFQDVFGHDAADEILGPDPVIRKLFPPK